MKKTGFEKKTSELFTIGAEKKIFLEKNQVIRQEGYVKLTKYLLC